MKHTNEHTKESEDRHVVGDIAEALAGLSDEERAVMMEIIRKVER